MQKLSNSKIISIITNLLGLVLLAKLIGLSLWWYLPNDGVELNTQESYQTAYQRVDFKNILKKSSSAPIEEKEQKTSSYSIKSIILKGLYGSGEYGFAIVASKRSPQETSIIEVGEVYKGYKLQSIAFEKVIFSKAGKEYVLYLEESKTKDFNKMVQKVVPLESGAVKKIAKKDIKYYSKNPKKFWKEIGIDEYLVDGKLAGFKVTKVKKGSDIEKLGLKKGDILTKANNMELNSLKNVAKLYNNLNSLEGINLVFLRDNQEMEINYEIN